MSLRFPVFIFAAVWVIASFAVAAPVFAGPPLTDSVRVVIYQEGVENAYPHWSKDGKSILYQSNRTGKWQLYIISRDGSGDRRITNDEFNNYMADWSPDNSRIAFVSDRSGNEEIFVINADGTGERNLTNNPARDIHPYWMPDGKNLYFNSTRANSNILSIFTMTDSGMNIKTISTTPDDETCAHLSNDGTKIVYLRAYLGQNDEIFVMDAATGKVTNVSNTPASEGWPCWAPDGKSVVYASAQHGVFNLFQKNLANESPKRLTHVNSPWYDARPMVSPDGKEIVFNRQKEGSIGIVIMRVR